MRASADATVELLRGHGLENVRTAGVEGSQPFVIGEWMHAGPDVADRPAVRAPRRAAAGIVENWASDPFEPEERDGRLYGRGSADDKAGAVAHAHAVGAWLTSAGALPCNVRVLVEGEEEIGSPTLHAFLTAHLEELRSDVLVLADAGNWQVGVPGLTYSLRGLAAADIELRALDGPQHSGMIGRRDPRSGDGVVARCSSSLVDEHGDVAFDGAFDGLTEPAPEGARADRGLRRRARALRPRVRACARACSSSAIPTIALHERLWLRPCLTVIGIDGHPIKGSSNQIVARGDGARQPAARPGSGTGAGARATCARTSSSTCRGGSSARSPRSKARPRGRPIRPVPRSTRRGARCTPASASSRC